MGFVIVTRKASGHREMISVKYVGRYSISHLRAVLNRMAYADAKYLLVSRLVNRDSLARFYICKIFSAESSLPLFIHDQLISARQNPPQQPKDSSLLDVFGISNVLKYLFRCTYI